MILTHLKTFCVLHKCGCVNLVRKNHFLTNLKSSFKPPRNTRFFFSFFLKRSQRQLKEADNVPDSFEMIYRNKMSHYLLGAQIVTLLCGGTVMLGILFRSRNLDSKRDSLEWSSTAAPAKNEDLYYIVFFGIFLVLMQTMVARTPIRIYKVPQKPKYISISYGNYLFGKQTVTFLRGEVSRIDPRGILPWKESRYVILSKSERKPVILLDYFFRRPADLSIMLGEQKDPELEETK